MRNYFLNIGAENIQPGDVFATKGHTEIVTSNLSEKTIQREGKTVTSKIFSSIGAGKNGIGIEENSDVRPTGKVFRRVVT